MGRQPVRAWQAGSYRYAIGPSRYRSCGEPGALFVGMGRQPMRYGLPRSNLGPWAPPPVACFRPAYGIRRDVPAAALALPLGELARR